MKSAVNSPNNRAALLVLMALTGLLLLALTINGCGTVAPKPVKASASWDGTNQNSGFIGWAAGGCGVLTPHAYERYNSLIKVYGDRFHPPLTEGRGVIGYTNGTYLFTPEAISDFAAMNRWRRMEGK